MLKRNRLSNVIISSKIFESLIIKVIILIQRSVEYAKVITSLQHSSSLLLKTETITQRSSSIKSDYLESFSEDELKVTETLISKYAIILELSSRQYNTIVRDTLSCVWAIKNLIKDNKFNDVTAYITHLYKKEYKVMMNANKALNETKLRRLIWSKDDMKHELSNKN